MSKYLLDTNLSPQTSLFLQATFGFNVIDMITEEKFMLSDEEIVALAKKEKRVIITFDLDFGEIYFLREKGAFGVIILRIQDQTVESVNTRLDKFFRNENKNIRLEHSLVVLEEKRIRILPSV